MSAILLFSAIRCFAAVAPTDLRCEYRKDPLGIDNVRPRLSWKIVDSDHTRGQKQTAYQVLVSSSLERLNRNIGDLWDSKVMAVSGSVNNVYQGAPLTSGQSCYWKVRVKDVSGTASEWSPIARFTVGLLEPGDWKGAWIYKADQEKTNHNWYRKNFTLSDAPKSGMVYVGSFGYHELYVNGEKVTDNVMNPVSSYLKKRVPYLTYDITDKLRKGNNVIAIWHAAGWTRWSRIREYRNPPFVFKAQIEIETAGTTLTLVSDTSWKCKKSDSEYLGDWDILKFGGERIDARRLEPDWNQAAYDDSSWTNASVWKGDVPAQLSAQRVEPQVRYETILPVAVTANDDGTYRIDMGRNYSGQFEINLRNGTEGQTVTFEISDQKELRCNWAQKSEYIYGRTGQGTFANRFNLAGGRWITVSGLNYKPELSDIKGHVITCDRRRTSKFECSDELLNRIYEMNLATAIANTLDGIMMDCPHRERRGWGEVSVAALYGDALPNFESGAYMDQYFQYMRDAQFEDGRNRGIINEEDRPFLMWQANNPITVWEAYRMLGDQEMLRANYVPMERWMAWLLEHSDYSKGGALIIGKPGKREWPGLGDWCTPKGNFWESMNSPEAAHFNNCLYAYMLDCAVKIATALDRPEDAKMYADRLRVQRQATHKLYYDPNTGNYGNGQQVNQAFALIAGVPPESEGKKVYDNLVDKALYAFPYYDVGSSGQGLYTRYFIEHGERMDLIYELLTDKYHPSYGYFIAQGETTWPERWSSTGGSRIHTCYTGIGGYFIKGFGGIRPDPDHVGMQHFLIKPAPVGALTYANTECESMYGKMVVNWKRSENAASYHLEIPVNTSARVFIPAVGREHVNEGAVLAENAKGVSFLGVEASDAVGNYVIYQVESGVYDFSVGALPKASFPEPEYKGTNLARIGRMNASSMFVEGEKGPGFEPFKANDGKMETSWKAGGKDDQWLEVEWMKPQTFDKVVISESGDQIKNYRVQYWNGSTWRDLAAGTTCGRSKVHSFNQVTSGKCRLYFPGTSEAVSIAEFDIHGAAR
ncbi:MAG: family 78 glycoside hydrolase catalytic domain [Verrucomicrobia bacterium]|nr:family 78 glycoside hydrolase catalytic domain [Verrucomicrobiota bacterium]